LDEEHPSVSDGDARFEAVNFERLIRSRVRKRFFPEDGAEEEVEFVDLVGIEGWEGYGGCCYCLYSVSSSNGEKLESL